MRLRFVFAVVLLPCLTGCITYRCPSMRADYSALSELKQRQHEELRPSIARDSLKLELPAGNASTGR